MDYSRLCVDIESPSGLRWVTGRNKGKPIGTLTENQCGYKFYVMSFQGKQLPCHRAVYEITHGPIPDGYQIDHIDRNPLNNHPDNLRLALPHENAANRQGIQRDLPKGISMTPSGSFACRIKRKGMTLCKNHSSLTAAIEWLRVTRNQLHGQYACHI